MYRQYALNQSWINSGPPSVILAHIESFSPSHYFMLAVPACWGYRYNALNQSWVDVGPPSVTVAHIELETKHDPVTQYWAIVESASYTGGQHSLALGQRLVFDRQHDRKPAGRKINGTQRPQTERTEVKQHVPTSVYRRET